MIDYSKNLIFFYKLKHLPIGKFPNTALWLNRIRFKLWSVLLLRILNFMKDNFIVSTEPMAICKN